MNGRTSDMLLVIAVTLLVGCANPTGDVSADKGAVESDYISATIGTMKYVPAGTFQRDATPTNTAAVSAFRISVYEITVDQFVAVTGLANPSTEFLSVVDGPAQMTSWYHALVFCNDLSIAEGLTPVYRINGSTNPVNWGLVPTSSNPTWDAVTADWSAGGYRLPTEMEWMWAGMGATDGTTGYLKAFAGSTGANAIEDYAWYQTNANNTTHTIGTRLPNQLGLRDMSGNVWEWCWDWLGSAPSGALTNYRGPGTGTNRGGRGGCWFFTAASCRVGYQSGAAPSSQASNFGFRVVRR